MVASTAGGVKLQLCRLSPRGSSSFRAFRKHYPGEHAAKPGGLRVRSRSEISVLSRSWTTAPAWLPALLYL